MKFSSNHDNEVRTPNWDPNWDGIKEIIYRLGLSSAIVPNYFAYIYYQHSKRREFITGTFSLHSPCRRYRLTSPSFHQHSNDDGTFQGFKNFNQSFTFDDTKSSQVIKKNAMYTFHCHSNVLASIGKPK